MKYVVVRDAKPVKICDSSPEAMDYVEEIRKVSEGWFTIDLSPPHHRFTNATWIIYGIFEEEDLLPK